MPRFFAGLWDTWESGSEEIRSCTIITTVSNELVAEIHDRMPVIVSPAQYPNWLDPMERKAESLNGLLVPYPAEEMVAYEVSAKVNDPKTEGADLLETVD